MTLNEHKQELLETRARFYSWKPGDTSQFHEFRCYHISSRPRMSEKMCQARAGKPEIFSDCTNRCPRWRHYRRLVKKTNGDDGLIRRAYR